MLHNLCCRIDKICSYTLEYPCQAGVRGISPDAPRLPPRGAETGPCGQTGAVGLSSGFVVPYAPQPLLTDRQNMSLCPGVPMPYRRPRFSSDAPRLPPPRSGHRTKRSDGSNRAKQKLSRSICHIIFRFQNDMKCVKSGRTRAMQASEAFSAAQRAFIFQISK